MKIQYTYKAIADLERMHNFIAADNPKAAAETADRIINAIEQLIEFPLMGRRVKGHKVKTPLRDLITGKYNIRYVILKHEIQIVRIWHGKENLFT